MWFTFLFFFLGEGDGDMSTGAVVGDAELAASEDPVAEVSSVGSTIS